MKIVVAPDSFKESLSALEVSRTIAEAIREVLPTANIVIAPMADGGEGTVEALVACGQGLLLQTEVTGPLGQPIQAVYGILHENKAQDGFGNKTAVLEAAAIFGLALVPTEERDPYRTTTKGMGQLIVQLLDEGVRRFIIGLGGSSTNDGGMGLLSALGLRFYNGNGTLLDGYGRDLLELQEIRIEELDPRLSQCTILIASDVDNPLCGDNGASAIYGPQKGATPDQIKALDRALVQYSDSLSALTGRTLKDQPGAGAAGGVGFALLMLGASIAPGAEVISSAAQFQQKLTGADWVITGEGRSDNQTLHGKLPVYVARLAKEAGVRTILLSGSIGSNYDELEREFAACFSCVPRPMALTECIDQAEVNLRSCARNIARLIQT